MLFSWLLRGRSDSEWSADSRDSGQSSSGAEADPPGDPPVDPPGDPPPCRTAPRETGRGTRAPPVDEADDQAPGAPTVPPGPATAPTLPRPTEPPDQASASVGAVVAVYPHSATQFDCTLCGHAARDFAGLRAHRRARHRAQSFEDWFSSGCACGTPFESRAAAARHERYCPTAAAAAALFGLASDGAEAPSCTPPEAMSQPTALRPTPPTPAPHHPPKRQREALAWAVTDDGKRRRLNEDNEDPAGPGAQLRSAADRHRDRASRVRARQHDQRQDEDIDDAPVIAAPAQHADADPEAVDPIDAQRLVTAPTGTPARESCGPGPRSGQPIVQDCDGDSPAGDVDTMRTDARQVTPADGTRPRDPGATKPACGHTPIQHLGPNAEGPATSADQRQVTEADGTGAGEQGPLSSQPAQPCSDATAGPRRRPNRPGDPASDAGTEPTGKESPPTSTMLQLADWERIEAQTPPDWADDLLFGLDPDLATPTVASRPRRTKTRWGPRLSSTATPATPAPAPRARSRTRWGPRLQPVPATGKAPPPAPISPELPPGRLKTRWGPRLVSATTAAEPAEPGIVPETPTRTTAVPEDQDPSPTATVMTPAVAGDVMARRGGPERSVSTPGGADAAPAIAEAPRRDARTSRDVRMTQAPPPRPRRRRKPRNESSTTPRATQRMDGATGTPATGPAAATTARATRDCPTPTRHVGMVEEPASVTQGHSARQPLRAPDTRSDQWVLRFDGACRSNPGPGGAGAALFGPDEALVWTCVHYMPGHETNNTAEYTALLAGIESAIKHGVTSLRVEGDSQLVLSQVRGVFLCANKRLRRLRDRIQHLLRQIPTTKLVHIDRKANAHADRLANRALDSKRTKTECALHADAADCCRPGPTPPRPADDASAVSPSSASRPDVDMAAPSDEEEAMEADASVAARGDGTVYPAMPIDGDHFPARQPRLRLRPLTDEEYDDAATAVTALADEWACKIEDAPDWSVGEGHVCAFPEELRRVLAPYAIELPQRRPPSRRQGQADPQRRRPPRVTRNQREHRLDEAIDDMEATQRSRPTQRQEIRRARRRVARIRDAAKQVELRKQFAKRERECVEAILAGARPETAQPAPTECPISSAELHEYFAGACTPRTAFDYDAATGAVFRGAIQASAPPDPVEQDALRQPPTLDEVEDQLKRARPGTSPGHDGLGYDVIKRFGSQLAPVLTAAFALCWRHGKVPATWKAGNVRLLYKKGDASRPASWRPICLQPTLYKLYTGLLARRLSLWLEANQQLPMSQKGFRAFNGCNENNFVGSSLLDQARRLHRKLYAVWYDLKDAFGSLPQPLMWRVLADMGVDSSFVTRCSALYDDAFFAVTNAADGTTAPVKQRWRRSCGHSTKSKASAYRLHSTLDRRAQRTPTTSRSSVTAPSASSDATALSLPSSSGPGCARTQPSVQCWR